VSTALIYCGLPEGFVIGADGRAFNKLTEQIESDTERKIFMFENDAASVVFAWSGIVKLIAPNGSCFSFVEETEDLLSQTDFSNSFTQRFNVRLKNKLRSLRTNEKGTGAFGILLSYRKDVPWVAQISAFKNGHTWDCIVDDGEANGNIDLVSGPGREFDKPQTLTDAENAISDYLDYCVSHPTEEIGGRVHIAKLTPEGFSWIRPPK
jgi:hypothetical protein